MYFYLCKTESDVYAGVNVTEETSTEFIGGSSDFTERPRTTHPNTNHGTSVNENCNASTPPMKVSSFPQEVHHYHHHSFSNFASVPSGGSCSPNGAHFANGGSGGSTQSSGGGPGGSTGFSFPTQDGGQQAGGAGAGASAGSASSIQQLQHQMRQVR